MLTLLKSSKTSKGSQNLESFNSSDRSQSSEKYAVRNNFTGPKTHASAHLRTNEDEAKRVEKKQQKMNSEANGGIHCTFRINVHVKSTLLRGTNKRK